MARSRPSPTFGATGRPTVPRAGGPRNACCFAFGTIPSCSSPPRSPWPSSRSMGWRASSARSCCSGPRSSSPRQLWLTTIRTAPGWLPAARLALCLAFIGLANVWLGGTTSYPMTALAVPVVALAASRGRRLEGIVALAGLVVMLVPLAAPAAVLVDRQEVMAVVIASIVMAIGSRRVVVNLERSSDRLRSANLRARRQTKQLAALESVGRLLRAGRPDRLQPRHRHGRARANLRLSVPIGVRVGWHGPPARRPAQLPVPDRGRQPGPGRDRPDRPDPRGGLPARCAQRPRVPVGRPGRGQRDRDPAGERRRAARHPERRDERRASPRCGRLRDPPDRRRPCRRGARPRPGAAEAHRARGAPRPADHLRNEARIKPRSGNDGRRGGHRGLGRHPRRFGPAGEPGRRIRPLPDQRGRRRRPVHHRQGAHGPARA